MTRFLNSLPPRYFMLPRILPMSDLIDHTVAAAHVSQQLRVQMLDAHPSQNTHWRIKQWLWASRPVRNWVPGMSNGEILK